MQNSQQTKRLNLNTLRAGLRYIRTWI